MSTPEGKVKAAIKKDIRKLGAYECWVVPFGMGKSGVPDLLLCYEGLFIGIELKAPGRRGEKNRGATPRQMLNLRSIRDNGGYAAIVDSVQEFRQVMACVQENKPYDFEEQL